MKPPIERFLNKIMPQEDGCWLWTAALHSAGYGIIGNQSGTFYAHRLSYEFFVGEIPQELDIDHLCRVRACVNPDHLEPVTRRENILRGTAGQITGARQRAKTHCCNGHEFDEKNTRLNMRGSRVCRACQREWARDKYHKRKAQRCA